MKVLTRDIAHPGYERPSLTNDIALVRLSRAHAARWKLAGINDEMYRALREIPLEAIPCDSDECQPSIRNPPALFCASSVISNPVTCEEHSLTN